MKHTAIAGASRWISSNTAHGPRIGGKHPPENMGKFIAARFERDSARPVDGYVAPQLA